MTRKHSAMSLSTSCLQMPLNPFSRQPSPSYERRQVVNPNTEDGCGLSRTLNPTSCSSHPRSNLHSPSTKCGAALNKKHSKQETSGSPLDSFLDFYESIPDYQDVTHLSDREFADRMKVLRDKQKQHLHNLSGRYSPLEFDASCRKGQDYSKKNCKGVNKLERANEWVNKSCDSLSSLERKSENEFGIRNFEEDTTVKKFVAPNDSPRKYVQYDVKDETEGLMMDTGSSLSTDSNVLKTRVSKTICIEDDPKPSTSTHTLQDCRTPSTSVGQSESCHGLSSFYGVKHGLSPNYGFYNMKDDASDSAKKKECAPPSAGTSEFHIPVCSSPLGLANHDMMCYDDFYVPTSGWIQSDSDSMFGAMHHIPFNRPSTGMLSQSLPSSPMTKQASSSMKTNSLKKKTRRKRRVNQKSITKPVPFSFMSNDRQPSRSTPDLSSQCRSPSPKHFRARPVPRNLFSNYVYKKKQEDEFFRALKRKVRGEGMLRAASLPPSMEFRERLGRVRAEAEAAEAAASSTASGGSEWRGERRGAAADGDLGDSSGGPGPTGPGRPAGSRPGGARRGHTHPRRPPDFSKCHDKMRQELYERQTRNITTSPSPYSLRTSSLSPRRKCLQGSAGSASSGSDSRRCRTRPRPRSSGSSPCVDAAGGDSGASRSNLAAVLRVQTARQRLEAEHHRLREEQLRRAEVRLKERLRRLTPAWRSIQYSTEEDLALRAAARRQEERQRRREHGVLMRHMLHRVHTIPTLFERQSASSWSPRSPCALEQCGPACPALVDLDDEDASDVKVFVRRAEEGEDEDDERVEDLRQGKRQGQRQSRPRQRQRPDRPCSAGLGGPGGSGGRRSRGPPEAQPKLAKHLCKQTPRGRGSTPGPWPGSPGSSATSALQALRSPDRISSKLRNYHRQLPHVEFSESQGESPHSLRGRDEDDDDDDDQGGAGASRSR